METRYTPTHTIDKIQYNQDGMTFSEWHYASNMIRGSKKLKEAILKFLDERAKLNDL
jgi:hypothetical protein